MGSSPEPPNSKRLILSVDAEVQDETPLAFGLPWVRNALYRDWISAVKEDCALVGFGTVPNWKKGLVK